MNQTKFNNMSNAMKLAFFLLAKDLQTVNICNFIAYDEFIDAVEMMEERGKTRFVKKNLDRAEKQWQKYFGFLSTALSKRNLAIVVDYSNAAYKKLRPKIDFFRGATAEYFAKGGKRTEDINLLAQLITAVTIFKLSVLLYGQYVEQYNEKYKYDFSDLADYADMQGIARTIEGIIKRLYPKMGETVFNDTLCVNAFDSFLDVITSENFFDNTLSDAIDKNTVLSRRKTADRLSEKYNVKQL